MNPFKKWLLEKTGKKCVDNLNKHRFDAHFFDTIEDAKSKIMDMVKDYNTFGFGGSDTTRGIGLPEALEEKGKTVYDHNKEDLSLETKMEYRKLQGTCDCFFSSANAISQTGEIINVDGVGNRVNATCFGPSKVIIVAGTNKIEKDMESAIKRIREVAAPMRSKSLGMENPCSETGICADCNSPTRICNITTILHRKPMLTDISVMIINDNLGY
ncbi:MAG: lactate utilization protein [Desulfobacterales bacterium]|nr:lactate utilization protein [Desulfobacterales bacterium]MCP4158741.1 lactate utilization protein [Deltaproteobacteria bacterium]